MLVLYLSEKTNLIEYTTRKRTIFKRFNKDNINEMTHKSDPGMPGHIHIYSLLMKKRLKRHV